MIRPALPQPLPLYARRFKRGQGPSTCTPAISHRLMDVLSKGVMSWSISSTPSRWKIASGLIATVTTIFIPVLCQALAFLLVQRVTFCSVQYGLFEP